MFIPDLRIILMQETFFLTAGFIHIQTTFEHFYLVCMLFKPNQALLMKENFDSHENNIK